MVAKGIEWSVACTLQIIQKKHGWEKRELCC